MTLQLGLSSDCHCPRLCLWQIEDRTPFFPVPPYSLGFPFRNEGDGCKNGFDSPPVLFFSLLLLLNEWRVFRRLAHFLRLPLAPTLPPHSEADAAHSPSYDLLVGMEMALLKVEEDKAGSEGSPPGVVFLPFPTYVFFSPKARTTIRLWRALRRQRTFDPGVFRRPLN